MTLIAFGINHTTAPVSVRERVAFSPEEMATALRDLVSSTDLDEASILSTCNRTELLLGFDRDRLGDEMAQTQLLKWLSQYRSVNTDELSSVSYCHYDIDAFAHMSRVAAGLNSLVLGEPQILGQVKSAYAVAREAGTAQSELSQAFEQCFALAKNIRTQTAIGSNPVSVAFAAVSLSKRIFSRLDRSQALLIGAGETIELVAKHLAEQGVKSLVVANRTFERAEALADKFGAKPILLADIPDALKDSDIVISSTASQLPILGKGMVEQALKGRRHKPIFMVDIAVPRDIEEQVKELSDVYLYTVDDLKGIIDENIKARESEAVKAEEIISQGVQSFQQLLRSLDVVSTLRAYRQQAETTRDDELEKALKQLENGTRPEEVLASLARGLTNKLIHQPSVNMKKFAAHGSGDRVAWTQALLGIEIEDKG